MGPSLAGLSTAVHSKIVFCSKKWCCLNSTRTLSGADLARQDIGALAAAEYGGLAVWEHSPLFSGLGAASIAADRCISAGAPSRPLTRFRFGLQLLFVARILRLYSVYVFIKKN